MDRIALRAPGRGLPWIVLLGRVVAGVDESLCQSLIDRGAIVCGGRRPRSALRDVPPGVRVELEAGGLELLAEPDLRADAYEVLVPAPPSNHGRLQPNADLELHYEVLEVRDGVARMHVRAADANAHAVLDGLAGSGWPVLGDGRRGGILVAGGPRIRPAPEAAEPGHASATTDWPAEPVFAVRPGDEESRPAWNVSAATARALARGHPWILPDDESDDPERLAPGTCVEIVDPHGHPLAEARLEGSGPVAARVWSWTDASDTSPPSGVEARVARAIARRRPLMRKGSARSEHRGQPHTDALRLIHGEADGLPGLTLDRLGSVLRVLVSGRSALSLTDRVVEASLSQLGDLLGNSPCVIEVLHLRASPSGRHECVRVMREGSGVSDATSLAAGRRHVVHERGLCFLVDPGLAEPERARPGFGLFLDQRENRERLARRARGGGRWLNLFAHTGAFSVALLAAGAEEVTSVDLSGAYLRWLESNLELNTERGVDAARHRSVRRDGRRYLASLARGDLFDGIVLDPPTAAAAGRRFWSASRDLEPLVAEALGRLVPGGVLLVCRNERRAKGTLQDVVRRASKRAGVKVAGLHDAGPGPDFPHLRGFPEGDSFQGAIVQRA